MPPFYFSCLGEYCNAALLCADNKYGNVSLRHIYCQIITFDHYCTFNLLSNIRLILMY